MSAIERAALELDACLAYTAEQGWHLVPNGPLDALIRRVEERPEPQVIEPEEDDDPPAPDLVSEDFHALIERINRAWRLAQGYAA